MDADIKGAFDNIDHDFLLKIIGEVPGRALIRQWLKAGYVDKGVFHATEAGTPQGGVISPLLANIALHGMEAALGVKHDNRGQIRGPRAVVRYADDFVVFCESKEDAEAVIGVLNGWLAERGLALSEEKTRIVHLRTGFDFLGWNIRHYPVKSTHTGYKLLIKPSKQAIRAIKTKLRHEWIRLRGGNVRAVLRTLNPIIRGWANYHRIGVASKVFYDLDAWMFRRAVRFVRHTHPHQSAHWQRQRYWGRLNPRRSRDRWVFGDTQTGYYLLKFRWFNIRRHAMVKGPFSSDDPTLRKYWVRRMAEKSNDLPRARQRVARVQNHVCPLCGESIHNGEEIHEHHLYGRQSDDIILVHLYCHQQVHSRNRERADAQIA